MDIRPARPDEAAAAAALVQRSITELCGDDYRHDQGVLARWLADKTPSNFQRWIGAGDRTVLTAHTDRLAGVGMVRHDGEILLNYVDPAARFAGVSKALLQAMEDVLRGVGRGEAILYSTANAVSLYRSAGYAEVRQVESRFGTRPVREMTRRL
jgi:GNAT superfamily N-acetyltransferase